MFPVKPHERRTLRSENVCKFLTNASSIARHANAKNVFSKLQLDNDKVILTIKDDGVGFDPSLIYSGNGMKNIRHRMNEINGDLKIESSPNNGSSFTYSISL